MKNVLKVLGIIAIVAVIWFGFLACGDDTSHTHTAGAAATCVTPQTCTSCSAVLQAALGHNWDWANYTSGSGLRKCKFDDCTVTAGVGDTGQAGGKIFYEIATVISEYNANYLEAAPSDQGKMLWCYGSNSDCDVTTGTAIGTGKANTAAIIAHANHSSDTASNNAAIAASITIGGKNDWFLPSKDELNEMYKARSHLGISSGAYWSSSQVERNRAWTQSVVSGFQGGSFTSEPTSSVRAIRAF